jgi:hypothetical protein
MPFMAPPSSLKRESTMVRIMKFFLAANREKGKGRRTLCLRP